MSPTEVEILEISKKNINIGPMAGRSRINSGSLPRSPRSIDGAISRARVYIYDMKLKVGNNQGYVIVDDNTAHVLDVFVMIDEDTFDNSITTSYRREGDKHFKL
jgi:hypothetical protein